MNHADQLKGLRAANLSLADQIDLICDSFEGEWLSGGTPRIEEFLNRCDRCDRERLLAELLLVDREIRIKQGKGASRKEYLQRFPDYSTVIDALEFVTIEDRVNKSSLACRIRAMPTRGAKLAHFELLDVLGSGASGMVWKACDNRLRRLVAIKLPRQESLSDPERARFLREGRACAQLRHPNIVPLYDVGEDLGHVFIVTQFVEGVNLREWLKEHRPKPRETAELAAQLAEALHYAHEQGIIHRDLKPANVLIDMEGRPHITDFGLAKLDSDSQGMTVEGEILGTPAYMSPEQAQGDAFKVDRRSDVYGLGTLLYETLTGHPPFEGEIAAIIHQVIHDEPRPPRKVCSAVPRDLETICMKAMEKESRRRYPSAQEMAVDLRRFLRGESILVRRISRFEKCWRWLRRRPAAIIAIVSSMLVALAGVMIAGLVEQNYALEGYRPVRIITEPAGARVALVPIDERTGEPNPDSAGIIRPRELTPLTTLAKPDKYFVEAVLPGGGDVPNFAEVCFVVPARAIKQRDRENGHEGDVNTILRIRIEPTQDVIANMVAVKIEDRLRRKYPLLPKVLYVDVNETAAGDLKKHGPEARSHWGMNEEGDTDFRVKGAINSAEAICKRLPTAAEYDAIVECTRQRKLTLAGSGKPATINGLFGGVAEWTMTAYDFPGTGAHGPVATLRKMIVLKGYGEMDASPGMLRSPDGQLLGSSDTSLPMIGWRAVRSGAPRFVKP